MIVKIQMTMIEEKVKVTAILMYQCFQVCAMSAHAYMCSAYSTYMYAILY